MIWRELLSWKTEAHVQCFFFQFQVGDKQIHSALSLMQCNSEAMATAPWDAGHDFVALPWLLWVDILAFLERTA